MGEWDWGGWKPDRNGWVETYSDQFRLWKYRSKVKDVRYGILATGNRRIKDFKRKPTRKQAMTAICKYRLNKLA